MPHKLCEKDPAGVRATLAEPTAGIRPPQDVDVLVVLDFQISRQWTETSMSVSDSRTGTRASKTQDGADSNGTHSFEWNQSCQDTR